jgi:mitogen-activated protein kinase kinase kinase
MQAIFKIGNKTGADASPSIPDVASEELKAFLDMTFRGEHEMRPSAEELLKHAWINRDLK